MTNPPPMEPQGSNPFGESNPFSDNPYVPPRLDAGSFPPVGRASSQNMVGHVPVVAILMMVQGGLEVLMGLGLVAIGGIFPVLMRMGEMRGGEEGPSPEMVGWMMLAIYGGLGLVTLVAAGLHLFAGLRNYRFRSRTLGLVALGGGLVTIFTCYCAPTTVALAVYGLITYLNADVGKAFALGEAGRKRSEILTMFR